MIHSPWLKELGKNKNGLWNITCDGAIRLAQSIPMVPPLVTPGEPAEMGLIFRPVPGR